MKKKLTPAEMYRAMLREYAPDITDADIVRLKTFSPRLTPISFALRRVFK